MSPSAERGLRLLEVGDHFFHRAGEREWLYDWPFPAEEILELWRAHAPVEEYAFWGRLTDRAPAPNEMTYPFRETDAVRVVGVVSPGRGLRSYLRVGPAALVRGIAAMRRADIISFQVPSTFTMVFFPIALAMRKTTIVRVRGDVQYVLKAAGKLPIGSKLVSAFTRWALRVCDVPVCVSEYLKRVYGNERTLALHDCIIWQRDIAPRAHAGDPGRLLFVGRLSPEKSLPTLIDAVSSLRAEGRDVRLDVVGSGELMESLQEHVSRLGLGGAVTFVGSVADRSRLYEIYDKAAVFVLPSLTEGLGAVIIEAMARGVPVVATRSGGATDLVRDGETGLLVDPGDSAALAKAIARMLDDGALQARCVEAAAQLAAQLTVEKQIGGWIRAAVDAYRVRHGNRLLAPDGTVTR